MGIAVIFAVVGSLVVLQAENSLQTSSIGKVTSRIPDQTLVMVMGGEIPYLKESVDAPDMEGLASRLFIDLATSIDFRDPRTFLGRELPLFALFDSEIVLASSDVDYTSIPVESPPPPELEKEILKGLESSQEEEPPSVAKESGLSKRVLIYTTHFWESYLPELKEKGSANKASDLKVNVTTLSNYLAQRLEQQGVGAIATHKKYTWEGSYGKSRKMVQTVMKQNQDITYLIDIHRDSLRRNKTTLTHDGKSYARLAFIVGKSSKNYEENLQLARQLHNELNQLVPGISRAVITKERAHGNNGEYNQSLSPNSMLVEVGGVDNNFEEGYRSLDLLAKLIAERINPATPVMSQPK
ncbi:stage II sporulation protein P [Hazenella coriacea]|nr:stage II sporulation protein P [Hazenella coriacea]